MSQISRSTARRAVLALQLLIVVVVLLTMVPIIHSRPLAAPATADEQVPFTATATAVITGVTHLPGGLTQVNFNTSGKANHLGDFMGPLTRIQDNQGLECYPDAQL